MVDLPFNVIKAHLVAVFVFFVTAALFIEIIFGKLTAAKQQAILLLLWDATNLGEKLVANHHWTNSP